MTLKSWAMVISGVLLWTVVLVLLMSKGLIKSEDVKTVVRNVGQIKHAGGLVVVVFELKTQDTLCIIPVHDYTREGRVAVPFMHCQKR